MMAIAPITNEADYQRANERISALMNSWTTRAEFDELRGLAIQAEKYSMEHHEIWNVHTDAADELEFLLDMENTTLDQLDSLLGGRDVLVDIMTRRRRLTESEVDRLAARLKVDWEELDREIRKPQGWQDIEIDYDMSPDHWRVQLLAHRDANNDEQDTQDAEPGQAGTTEREPQRMPNLAATT